MNVIKVQYEQLRNSLDGYVIFPPAGLNAMYFMCTVPLGMIQFYGQIMSPLQYSKFRPSSMDKNSGIIISGRAFYNVCYIPSVLVAAFTLWKFTKQQKLAATQLVDPALMHLMAPTAMMLVHFLKRVFEANFVHITSGGSPLALGLFIGAQYSIGLAMQAAEQLFRSKKSQYVNCKKSLYLGVSLFTIGELGNLYHHLLLRNIRAVKGREKQKKEYVVPQGGLFSFVWTPHYLFEWIAMLGITITSRHAVYLPGTVQMLGYLLGRSLKTKEWYEKKFGSDCPHRDAMIPYLW